MKGCGDVLPIYTRARINIKVARSFWLKRLLNTCFPTCFENQPLSRYPRKKHEKRVANAWSICCKAVILHPLSREKRGTVEMLNRDGVLNLPLQKKLFLKKKLRKVLVVQK